MLNTHLTNAFDALVDEDWTMATDSFAGALVAGLPAGVDLVAVRAWVDDLQNERRFWTDLQLGTYRQELFALLVEINARQRQQAACTITLKPTRKQQQRQQR